MQYLLLARHGNTFASGQRAVWVGARNDLPLVQTGIAQAESLAAHLKQADILPQAIYAASLKRTTTYAQIIHDYLQLKRPLNIDERLNEIDYGAWSGLSNDDIGVQFGVKELDEWNQLGKWPRSFSGNESDIENDVQLFVRDIIESQPTNKMVLAVTSNGRLKYFLKLMPAIYKDYIEKLKWKVSTGNVCLLGYDKKIWQLICWNENPSLIKAWAHNF